MLNEKVAARKDLNNLKVEQSDWFRSNRQSTENNESPNGFKRQVTTNAQETSFHAESQRNHSPSQHTRNHASIETTPKSTFKKPEMKTESDLNTYIQQQIDAEKQKFMKVARAATFRLQRELTIGSGKRPQPLLKETNSVSESSLSESEFTVVEEEPTP